MKLFKGKAVKALMALSIALPTQSFWLAPAAHAEGPTDPAPFINAKVVNENAGKKVLFDNTHAETSGAADWVIDGGFSDFGNALANAGYYVKELRKTTPITLADLQGYDVFVMAEANIPLKVSEQQAILDYVQGGGSIFFIADHYNADRNKNRWDGSESFNGYRRGAWDNPAKGMSAEEANSAAMQGVVSSDWLGQNFGVRFRYNALGDINATTIVPPDQAFGITQGVNAVAVHAGGTLAILDPLKAKGLVYVPTNPPAWGSAVDQGVYANGGVAEGPFSAVSKVGLGKAGFIGDSSPVEDSSPKYLNEETGKPKTTYDGFKEVDDATYFVNMVNWLAKKESYTSLDQVAGLSLDSPTPLLPMENPQTSTEPQAEPWATGAAGYKWWDQSTFKPGSYGGANASNPDYSFVTQATLPNAQDFQVRVMFDKMIPNSTASGFSVGVYNGVGQLAKVQNDDGTWPSSYGYSASFSVKADAKGQAYKDFTVRLNPTSTGAANLRIRQNSTALKTVPVTIDNVPAEPLPDAPAPEKPTIPDKISIGEARTKAESTLVTVEGVITSTPGAYGGQAFYLQDDTAGVYVYQTGSGFQPGDKVTVSGTTEIYNGELEISNPLAITKNGTATLPAPKVVSALDDQVQGQIVTLENVTLSNIVAANPANSGTFEFDATNGTNTTHVRVDNRTGLTLTAFPYHEGDVVNVTGAASFNNGKYLLRSRGLSDFAAATTSPTDPGTPPTDPTDPTDPGTPPTDPTDPTDPGTPPTDPTDPTDPGTPPTDPTDPTDPGTPPTDPGTPGGDTGNNGGNNGGDTGNNNGGNNGGNTENNVGKIENTGNGVKVTVDQQKLDQNIADSLKNGQTVVLDLKGQGANVVTELNASAFKSMADKQSNSELQIQTDSATLSLKAAQVQQALAKLGITLDNAKVSVTVNKLDNSLINTAIVKLNSLINPLTIKVEVAADGHNYSLDQAVKPTVSLPSTASNVASKNLAGVMIDPQTKKVIPVPTLFNTVNGTVQATFLNQNSNLVYTIVQNDKSFSDVAADSYAKEAIDTLANKFVVSGVSEQSYNPNAEIKRGDFAILLVRALGINADDSATSTFKDVQANDYYAANVEMAHKLGLISGYEDGTFRANNEITREEMAAMIYRAMQLTGTAKEQTDAEKAQNLAKFQDQGNIADWAKEAAAFVISQGIIQGTAQGQFSPDNQADRAQSATILFRALKSMNYLN